MLRKNGYLDLRKILRIEDLDEPNTIIGSLKTNDEIEDLVVHSKKEISFIFTRGENRFYFESLSFDDIVKRIVIEEIAASMHITSQNSDIATIGPFRGILIDRTKREETTYLDKEALLAHFQRDITPEEANNLEDLWSQLEGRYSNSKNGSLIVQNLMYDFVKLFILNAFKYPLEQGVDDWIIEEKNGKSVNVIRTIGTYYPRKEKNPLGLTESRVSKDQGPLNNLENFIKKSSREFKTLIEEYLWIISYKNVLDILKRAETRLEIEIDRPLKIEILGELYYQYTSLIKILNISPTCDIDEADFDEMTDFLEAQAYAIGEGIAVSILMPNEMHHIYHQDVRVNRHRYIYLLALKQIYNMGSKDDVYSKELLIKLDNEIKEKDFIEVSYVYRPDSKEVYFFVPAVITPFEYESLKKIKSELDPDTDVLFLIEDYDPRTKKHFKPDDLNSEFSPREEDDAGQAFRGKQGSPEIIDHCLDYMVRNRRVKEYCIDYPKTRQIT